MEVYQCISECRVPAAERHGNVGGRKACIVPWCGKSLGFEYHADLFFEGEVGLTPPGLKYFSFNPLTRPQKGR